MTPDTLREIYTRTARSGNTTALVEFAKAHGACIVVHDAHEEARVKRLGADAISVERGTMAFVGSRRGYIVDLPVVAAAANGWAAAIAQRARERDEATAKIASLTTQVEIAEARARADRLVAFDLTARVADLEAELAGKYDADQAYTSALNYRRGIALDDIRCAILDTGHPLGDDTDPELTPLRLVREVLAKLAALPEPEPERDAPQRR